MQKWIFFHPQCIWFVSICNSASLPPQQPCSSCTLYGVKAELGPPPARRPVSAGARVEFGGSLLLVLLDRRQHPSEEIREQVCACVLPGIVPSAKFTWFRSVVAPPPPARHIPHPPRHVPTLGVFGTRFAAPTMIRPRFQRTAQDPRRRRLRCTTWWWTDAPRSSRGTTPVHPRARRRSPYGEGGLLECYPPKKQSECFQVLFHVLRS